jgi:hypothetical protein
MMVRSTNPELAGLQKVESKQEYASSHTSVVGDIGVTPAQLTNHAES